jgi:hypothetical protein
MVFNATFNNISVITWGQFYWWWEPEKTTDRKLMTNFISIMLYRVHLVICMIRTCNFSGDLH